MTDYKRYYAFDSLRAIMMLLGVVLHAAMTYSSRHEIRFPLKSQETSELFYFLIYFIHTFRMPVFFLIAGFFGAFLFYTKGPEQMLKNRFRRIFLPLLVFLILLQPFISFAFTFCLAVFNGEAPVSVRDHFSSLDSYIPFSLGHLWFLYYLFMISVLVYLFSKLTKSSSGSFVDNLFERTFKTPIYRLLIMSALSFTVLFSFNIAAFETSISPIPDAAILIYFFVFYMIGWLLYRKKELVDTLTQFDTLTLAIGIVAFCLKAYFGNQMSMTFLQLTNSIITCALTLGITGLFLRFADRPNKKVSYFVNAAYWVYLVHFVIAILLSGFMYSFAISVYLKFFIVLTITTMISLITYHFFVRNTFIGVFLNGKKRNTKKDS